jgi:hypothetical protein
MIRPRPTAPVLALALLATAATAQAPAQAQDIFIGTVKIEQEKVVLTRCDTAQNRYVLKDGAPEKPVAALARRLATLKAPVEATVIGEYEEDGEGAALRVSDIQDVEASTSCHLLDALSALEGASKPSDGAPPAPPR